MTAVPAPTPQSNESAQAALILPAQPQSTPQRRRTPHMAGRVSPPADT